MTKLNHDPKEETAEIPAELTVDQAIEAIQDVKLRSLLVAFAKRE